MSRWRIKAVRSYVIETLGVGGNYGSRESRPLDRR